ncbi:EscC/YscC/HrcC family type III secretion system outer membrane ring protein [Hahella sp. CCB-MM4]|uniref:type III secretion system outer membrane ring subunit SctC n=1 Tax=Hahella sp. (strain CCB-MM4) TaxID=1926491 RepID=UPI000B9B71A8|nr:type III secretion system outer membrane ring subunit SctC [Hahella sp. CCB-MM4]OZG74364.1 EscC/YscC/HrcC family type III secretion system outer membrane ring protein [Hahella sp. CCB-MM4]
MMGKMMRRVLSLIVLVILFFGAQAHGAGWPWAKLSYAHYAENEPIRELLQQFASSINTPIVISDKVQGVVNGNFEKASARDFIDRLAKIHSLLWYYDGQVLYVYDTSEVETDLIHLQSVSSQRLINTLADLGVLDRRFTLRAIVQEGIVMVSGPPRYTQLVREVADILLQSEDNPTNDVYVVRVFELKHAWADDRRIDTDGQQVLVPGVATTLQSILGRSIPETEVVSPPSRTVPKLKGTGLVQEHSRSDDTRNNNTPYSGPHNGDGSRSGGQEASGYVVANERLNAVIVHDRKSKMPLYEELIASLDQPRGQVEIEVSIIDVSTDRLDEMGFEWQINGSNGSFTNADFSESVLPRQVNELSFIVGERASFSTLLDNTQDLFLTRIRALSEEGDASVLSQPTILTQDNIEAVLDHSTTFYVRLVGEREVDLFPVSVGSVVRVTPHIVKDSDRSQIQLDINIEDGQQTGQAVDEIPAISKSVINTQALVNDQGSLLVGGYYFNQDTNSSRKIPLLGDIPVLGHLFRTDGNQLQKKARLFLISPRIITSDDPHPELNGDAETIIRDYREQMSLTPAGSCDKPHPRHGTLK